MQQARLVHAVSVEDALYLVFGELDLSLVEALEQLVALNVHAL